MKTNNTPALRNALRLALAATLPLASGLASAQEPDRPNEVRAGMYFVSYRTTADDLSGPFTPPGINIRLGDVNTPYFALLHHYDDHWTVELAGGVPPTTRTYGKGPATVGSVPFNGQEVATAKWFSPSLLVEYNFLDPSYAVRPFIGAGFNFTRFYDLISTPAGDAANGGPTQVKLTSSFGPAATVGGTWRIDPRFTLSASWSAARVNSNYTSDTVGVIRTTHIQFNPRTWVVAAGYRF